MNEKKPFKKLTKAQATDLLNAGSITQEIFDNLIANGQVATGIRSAKNVERGMLTADGRTIKPSFYFAGIGKNTDEAYTPEMMELKEAVNNLIYAATTEIKKEEETPSEV